MRLEFRADGTAVLMKSGEHNEDIHDSPLPSKTRGIPEDMKTIVRDISKTLKTKSPKEIITALTLRNLA